MVRMKNLDAFTLAAKSKKASIPVCFIAITLLSYLTSG